MRMLSFIGRTEFSAFSPKRRLNLRAGSCSFCATSRTKHTSAWVAMYSLLTKSVYC